MEYQKIINSLDNTPNEPIKFRTNIWLKLMMIYVERITVIVKLNLKFQDHGQVYLIIVMHVNQFQLMLVPLLIFTLLMTVLCLNLNKK